VSAQQARRGHLRRCVGLEAAGGGPTRKQVARTRRQRRVATRDGAAQHDMVREVAARLSDAADAVALGAVSRALHKVLAPELRERPRAPYARLARRRLCRPQARQRVCKLARMSNDAHRQRSFVARRRPRRAVRPTAALCASFAARELDRGLRRFRSGARAAGAIAPVLDSPGLSPRGIASVVDEDARRVRAAAALWCAPSAAPSDRPDPRLTLYSCGTAFLSWTQASATGAAVALWYAHPRRSRRHRITGPGRHRNELNIMCG
jgi:hypothetical protein